MCVLCITDPAGDTVLGEARHVQHLAVGQSLSLVGLVVRSDECVWICVRSEAASFFEFCDSSRFSMEQKIAVL